MTISSISTGADSGSIIVVVLFIAVMIAAGVYSSIQARKRREALAAWAAKLGLSFSEARDSRYEDTFPDFHQLRSGERDRYAYNIVSGRFRNRPLLAFDYHYVTTSTDSKGRRQTHHHNFSAVIVTSSVRLNALNMRPEGFLDRIGAAFGFEDINFESAEFSRKYKVSAKDRKWAYDVLHARAIEFLLTLEPFSMEFGNGNSVMFWRSGTWTPEQFEGAAYAVGGLLDLLPEYLIEQQRGDSGQSSGKEGVS